MRLLRHLIPIFIAAVELTIFVRSGSPSTESLSQPDFCPAAITDLEDGTICRCGRHPGESLELAKVDVEANPHAACTAPEPLRNACTDLLRLAPRLENDALAGKRTSVTAMVRQALADQKRLLKVKRAELREWDSSVQVQFARWFGTTQLETRDRIIERIDILLKLNDRYTEANFRRSENPSPGIFAYVRPTDPSKVFLDDAFVTAPPTGVNSKAGTITHEMSHFRIAGGTKDHAYGQAKCRDLARTRPELAVANADNFEYFVENAR